MKQSITIFKLLRGDCIKVDAEITNVENLSYQTRNGVRRYYQIGYKFDNYSGVCVIPEDEFSPFNQRLRYKAGEQLPILYLRNDPKVNAAAEIVSYDTVNSRLAIPAVIALSIILTFIFIVIQTKH